MSYIFYGAGSEETSSSADFTFDGSANLDLKGKRVVNLSHPVDEEDAVNLKYVTKELGVTKRGPKGDQGDVGKMAPVGRQGVKGDQGDPGPKGDQGNQGPRGEKGLRVEKGKKGDRGVRGDRGPKGEKGDQGLKGDSASTGSKGDKGDKGDTGPRGPKDDKGDPGQRGSDGNTGSQGATGPEGPTGPTGARGPKGEKGDQGHQGPIGATGPRGPKREKGDSGSSTTVNQNLSMRGYKVIQFGNPTQAQDATHKSYVDTQVSTRLTQGQADSRYLEVGGDAMGGSLSMGNNCITNLGSPTDDADAVSKFWVESKIPKGLYQVKGSPDSHTVEYKSTDVQSIVYRKVGNDKQLVFNFKQDLPNGFYIYDFDVRKTGNDTTGADVFLYGEAGLSDTNSKTLYRFWGKNRNNAGKEFSVGSDSGQGKRFLRIYRTNIQMHGGFELRGNDLFNHGLPYTVNIAGNYGELYHFLSQHVSLRAGTKLIGSSLTFVFQPDHNRSTTFETSCEFKIWRLK